MIFNLHSRLEGQHAFLSASQYSWINYDEEKLRDRYRNHKAAQEGVELHDIAAVLIRKGINLPEEQKTLNMYVNDAIGFRMAVEKILYYSDNWFGTCDAISFRKGKLRIHDLKTGVTPTTVHQLEVYAALFCEEYRMKPAEIEMEFRIYQDDEIRIYEGDTDVVTHIMSKGKMFDKIITEMREEMF